ncbi:MAG: hypothetical protein WCR36_10045 [Bacteroidaceae bacterium]
MKNHNDLDWSDIVDSYNLPLAKDTLRKASSPVPYGSVFVHEYLKSKNSDVNNTEVQNVRQTTTINADKTETSESQFYIEDESKLRDSDYLLRLHNYDPRYFELVSAKNSKWNSGSKILYSSKITVKPIKNSILEIDISNWFDKLDRKYSVPSVKISNDYLTGDKMLLLDISDLHMNLQASMLTTGNEYNCDIAEKLFFYVIYDVIGRTQSYKFNKIIFTIGGDMLNADNLQNTTTKGTPQTCDVHLYDAYERVCNMTVKAIDILKDIAPVDVIHIAGNHDEVTGYKFAKYIEAWFRNDCRVNIDASPLPRKYVVFGNTLFVFAHDGDMKKLPKLIADEARDVWSSVNFTEVFLQHLHTEQILLEENNMRIQRLPTISAKSKWTVDSGYNSKRQCKSFIYDKEDGLTDVLYTPVKNK